MAYLEQPEIDVKPACIWHMQQYCGMISSVGENCSVLDSDIEEMGHYFWDDYCPTDLSEDVKTYFGTYTSKRLLRWTGLLASLTANVDSYSFGSVLRGLDPLTLRRVTEEARFLAMAKPDPTDSFDYLLADYSFRIRLLEPFSECGQEQASVRRVRNDHKGTWICRTGNYQESAWFTRIVEKQRADSGFTVKYHAKMFQQPVDLELQIMREGKGLVLKRSLIRSKVKSELILKQLLELAQQKGLLNATESWANIYQIQQLEGFPFRIEVGRWSVRVHEGNVELFLD